MPAAKKHPLPFSSVPTRPQVIRDWMTRSPHSIGRDQTLADAHRLMTRHNLRHLPVIEKGKLVGVLTQRDLYFLETIAAVDPETDRVDEAMTPDVYCVAPEARISDVVSEMQERKYGCVLVVENTNVVGIFTTTDAMRLLLSLLVKT